MTRTTTTSEAHGTTTGRSHEVHDDSFVYDQDEAVALPPFDHHLYAGEIVDDLRGSLEEIIDSYAEIPSWKMGQLAPKVRKLVTTIKRLDAVSPFPFLPR